MMLPMLDGREGKGQDSTVSTRKEGFEKTLPGVGDT